MQRPKGKTYLNNAIFAVYKGEKLLVTGTAEECAEALNVKPKSIYWLITPTARKRLENRKNPEKATTAVVIEWE